MGRQPHAQLGIADAAEYLLAIVDEFKPADEAAETAIRKARVLAEAAVDYTFEAHRRNAIVKNALMEAARLAARKAARKRR